MKRRVVSIVLVLAMLLSMVPTSVFATNIDVPTGDDGIVQYVSLGASNTNGYGLYGYLPKEVSEDPLAASKADMNVYGYLRTPKAAYPAQVQAALAEKTGKEVELNQLAISSMRTDEVLYLLDNDEFDFDKVNDAYMQWRFTGGQSWFKIAEPGGIDALRAAYQKYLTEADVITIDLGWNNFGVYAFNNIKSILAGDCANGKDVNGDKKVDNDDNYWKAPKWDAIPEDLMTKEDYDEVRASVLAAMEKNMDGDSAALKDKMGYMLDALTYATLAAIGHFDSIVEWIYYYNPDAQIVVINIQNLADDLVVEFAGETLNLGDLYGELIDLVNLYRASESPYADKYAFADAGDVETFMDEIIDWNGDPTTLGGDMKDCFDMYDDSLYVRSIVEYMMVGQALSGLFQGYRNYAGTLGLTGVFADTKDGNGNSVADSKGYMYEFALGLNEEELLALDLAKLNLNSPGQHEAGDAEGPGANKKWDADEVPVYNAVELYGAAVAPHLKNLRGEAANVAAYDYVFENTLAALKAQKAALLTNVEGVPEEYWPAELVAGVARLTEAIEVILPTAEEQFAAKLQGVYETYHNTLNYAYDVVATIVQYVAGINELTINADSLNGFNNAADGMMGVVFGDIIDGAMAKFNYELYANGLQELPEGKTPEDFAVADYVLDESKFDPALTAILVLAVRYELGSSFFAHPNEAGHDQITAAVLKALAESDAGDFTDKKMDLYMSILKEKYPNLYPILMGETSMEGVDDLAIIVEMLKMAEIPLLADKDLDALEAELRAELRAFKDARTEEQAAEAEAACRALYNKLIALATAATATATKFEVTEDTKYLSLGDSTITGYGLTDYVDGQQNGWLQLISTAAHSVLAQELFGDNWKNQFTNFCQGSLRADDLLLFLGGEIEPDDYYYAEIETNLGGSLEETQDKFIAAVEKADVISVAIGGGNFLTFAGKYVNRVLKPETYGEPYELDWDSIGIVEKETMDELQSALDMMVPIIDALGLMDQYLPEGMEIEEPAKMARALAEGLLYGYASYNNNYTKVLERIKKINPDAQLLILGMFNPVDDWTMTTTMDGKETVLNIGGTVANMMESANLQTLAFALQNKNTSYIDVSEAETILENDNPGKELGFNDYYNAGFQTNGKAVHASADGHAYIAGQMLAALSGVNTDAEIEAIMADVYAALQDTYLTTEEKLGYLYQFYAYVREDIAESYSDILVLEKLYAYLSENEYIDDEQTLEIILCAFGYYLDSELTDEEITEIAIFVYSTLMDAENPARSIDMIKGVYGVLKTETDYLDSYAKYLDILEDLCAHKALEVVQPVQTYAIIDCLFNALIAYQNGEELDVRDVAYEIYFNILKVKSPVATFMLRSAPMPELSPSDKLAILEAVYEVLKDNDILDGSDPDLQAAEDLYEALVNEEMVPDALALEVFDAAIEAILTNETLTPEVITDVATEIVDKVMGEESGLSEEVKGAILNKVMDALEDSSYGESIAVVPGLDVTVALKDELRDAGYLTDKQAGQLIEALYPVLKNGTTPDAALADKVYNIVFNQPGQTIQDKFAILMIVYNVLDEYGYIDMGYAAAYAEAKKSGYVDEALAYIAAAIKAVEAGKLAAEKYPVSEELKDARDALVEELKATVQTLKAIEDILKADTKDTAWAELVELEAELNNHIDKLQALALEIGFVLDPYVQKAIDAYNYYAKLVADVAAEAYAQFLNGVEEFAAGYAALVEEIGKIADELHPELGVAVRKYLTETPADALDALYRHGKDAVFALMFYANEAYGSIEGTIALLGNALYENGAEIYNEIAKSDEVKAILARLNAAKVELEALYAGIEGPFTADYAGLIADAQDLVAKLYNDLYDEVSEIVVKVTGMEESAAMLQALRDALKELAKNADYIGAYGEWITGDMGLLMDELLLDLIANNDEFLRVFLPLFWQNMEFVNEYLTEMAKKYGTAACELYKMIRDEILYNIIPTIKQYGEDAWKQIQKQLNELCGMVNTAVETVKEVLKQLNEQLQALKAKFQAEAEAIVDQVEAMLETLKGLLEDAGLLSEEVLNKIWAAIEDVENALDALKNVIRGEFESIGAMLDALNSAANELLGALNALADILKAEAEGIYEQVKDQLAIVGEKVQCLIDNRDEIIEAVASWLLAELVEALPYIDETLYDFFYNNPDKVIAFFAEYGDELMALAEEYGMSVIAVLGYLAYEYGDELVAYVMENPEEVLAAMVKWYETYGDRTVAMLQVYAEALGLCDAVREQIADLEAQLDALRGELENASGLVKLQIEKQIAKIEKQIENLKAELKNLQAQVNALIAGVIENVTKDVEALFAEIEKQLAAIEAKIAEIEKLVNEKLQEAVEKLQALVEKKLGEAAAEIAAQIAEGVKVLGELLDKAEVAVQNAVKALGAYLVNALIESLPYIDEALYNWLYNNPDKVIAFFTEYGDEIYALVAEYGDEVLMGVAAILYLYGEDMLAYIIENNEEILANMKDWYATYGERTIAMLQVYAEALGLCDAVREQIAELEALLEELKAELEDANIFVKAQIEKQIAQIEKQIAELKAELEKLQDQIDALIKELITEVNAKVEDLIAEIEKTIAEIQKMVEEQLQAAVEKLQAQIEKQLDAAAAAIAAKIAEGVAALEALLAEAEEAVLDAINELVDALEQLYYDATHFEYVVDEDSFYVALGDGTAVSESYVDKLAAELEIDYVNLAQAGLLVEDLYDVIAENADTIAKADLITVGIGSCNFTDYVKNQAVGALAELINAELGEWLNNKYFGEALKEGLGAFVDLEAKTEPMDWERYIGAEGVAVLEEKLAEIKAKLIEEGIPEVYTIDVAVMLELPLDPGQLVINIPVVDLAVYMVECYLYGYATFALNYVDVFNEIHATAPEAELVIVGMFNPYDELVLTFGDATFALGEYAGYAVKAMNAHFLGYAMVTPKTTYVSVYDAESVTDAALADGAMNGLLAFLNAFISGEAAGLPTDAGHTYIKEQILNALNDKYLLGDVNMDGYVDSLDTNILYRYANEDESLGELSAAQLILGDVNMDGAVDSLDTNILYRYVYEDASLSWIPVEVSVNK